MILRRSLKRLVVENNLIKLFKSLVYADMAINHVYTGNVFNYEWRNNLPEKDRLELIKLASEMVKK